MQRQIRKLQWHPSQLKTTSLGFVTSAVNWQENIATTVAKSALAAVPFSADQYKASKLKIKAIFSSLIFGLILFFHTCFADTVTFTSAAREVTATLPWRLAKIANFADFRLAKMQAWNGPGSWRMANLQRTKRAQLALLILRLWRQRHPLSFKCPLQAAQESIQLCPWVTRPKSVIVSTRWKWSNNKLKILTLKYFLQKNISKVT